MSTTTASPLSQTVNDINLLSTFLANAQLSSLQPPINTIPSPPTTTPPTINPTTLIIAPSAILSQAHTLFKTLLSSLPHPSPIHTILFTGGTGHSTPHLRTAILTSPLYHTLPSLITTPSVQSPPSSSSSSLDHLSEAKLWYLLFTHFHDGARIAREWDSGRGLRVLLEEKSTNCGENAAMTRLVLEGDGVVWGDGGQDVVVVQDPTMSLRMKATFEKVYSAEVGRGVVRFWSWTGFVPRVEVGRERGRDGEEEVVVWDGRAMGVEVGGLWDLKRFYGLVLGEVVRLRDDENGYGPKGKGFIAHVDVPEDVLGAWERLRGALEFER